MSDELTDERLTELRVLAEMASEHAPGSWAKRMGAMGNPADGPDFLAVYDATGEDICQMQDFSRAGSDLASHVAMFDPPTELALVAEIERLRAQRDTKPCMHTTQYARHRS